MTRGGFHRESSSSWYWETWNLSTEAATGKGEASRKDIAHGRLACVDSIYKTRRVSATVAGQKKMEPDCRCQSKQCSLKIFLWLRVRMPSSQLFLFQVIRLKKYIFPEFPVHQRSRQELQVWHNSEALKKHRAWRHTRLGDVTLQPCPRQLFGFHFFLSLTIFPSENRWSWWHMILIPAHGAWEF